MAENKGDEMYSMSYKDARDKFGAGVGSNKYFMSESDFEKGKAEYNKKKNVEKPAVPNKEEKPAEQKKQQSLVANKFGAKKEKTWNDVKSEYNNDPAKIADYLNNATDYTPGNLTKKGMEEFGYSQGTDGKWAAKPKTPTATSTTETKTTTDDALNGVEGITNEDQKAKGFVDSVTNEDGSVNEQKALNAMSQYEQKLVEAGAGSFDKDGKFVFKDTTKKGWEDFATMLSVGASVIGLAMGVPIVPINFRKITNKDEKDAKIREFQKQYADIMAGNAAKVEDVKSSAEAGKLARSNEEDINAYSKYAENTAAYKAKSDINAYSKYKEDLGAYEAKSNIDTGSEKELIETRTDAQIKADEKQFERDMKRLESDRDFQIKFAALQQQYAKEMAQLQSDLSTGSAIDLMKYQNSGFLKDLKDMGITPKELASYAASKNGVSPADKNWNRVNILGNILGQALGAIF